MNNKLIMLGLYALLCSKVAAAPDYKCETACLKSASSFAIGGIGFVGVISEPEKSLHAMLRQPSPKQHFASLLKTATLEGQLYALLGLKLTDKQAFLRVGKPYLRMKQRIKYVSADIVTSQPINVIVKQIAHGDYDAMVTKD